MRRLPWAIAVCLLASAARQGTGQTTAPQADQADRLAARSLLHSAKSLAYAPAGEPARARRLLAHGAYAAMLAPADPAVSALLSDVHEMQGQLDQAAQEARLELEANGANYSAGLRWLRLALAAQERSDQRLALLEQAAGQDNLPAAVRAQALVEKAAMLAGLGEQDQAREAFAEALKLDPYLPAAVEGSLASGRGATAADRLAAMLDIIRGDPQALNVVWDLGMLLDSLGLYEPALKAFEHVHHMMIAGGRGGMNETFAVHYANALLDAGKCQEASDLLERQLKQFERNVDLISLAVEAYRDCGKADRAAALVARLATILKGEDWPQARKFGMQELAQFFTHVDPKPLTALSYAQKAHDRASDPITVRILGCAELNAGLVDQGLSRLNGLADKDPYAALCLAEHFYRSNDPQAAKDAILAGATVTRSGPAFRSLAALASKHQLELPAPPQAQAAVERLEKFDWRRLEMAREPAKYVRVSVRPAKSAFAPMEPIEVDVTLTNIGELDVPLGPRGLFSPAVALEAQVAGAKDGLFANLPMAQLPAGRYLRPGQSVSATVRLDVGEFETFLLRRPLERLTISVAGVVDPFQRANAMHSTLPALKVDGGSFVRADVVSQFSQTASKGPAEAYRLALGYIVRDFKQGDLARRMRAARQVGSLLTYVGLVQGGMVTLPKEYAGAVDRPVLLSMMRALLEDPSAVVRAEMVASLRTAGLDQIAIALLKPLAGDGEPLVRFRLAELLGIHSRSAFAAETSKALADDPYEMVRRMAAAFR